MAIVAEGVRGRVYLSPTDGPIEVRISPDDLVILSYPGPDRSVRLDQLRIGRALPRRYRNRRIGDFLKELEITEGRSTGIPKIFRAMERNGSPRPEFEFDDDHSFFLVRLPRHADFSKEDAIPQTETAQVTGQVISEVTPEVKNLANILPDSILEQLDVAFPRATAQVTDKSFSTVGSLGQPERSWRIWASVTGRHSKPTTSFL